MTERREFLTGAIAGLQNRIDEVNNVIRYQHDLNNLKEHISLLQFFRISKLCVEVVKPLSELQQELTSIQFKLQQELDREVNQTM